MSKAAVFSAYTTNSGTAHITSLAILLVQNTGPLTIPTSQSVVTSINKNSKGKVYPCTGTEALYRPYGP